MEPPGASARQVRYKCKGRQMTSRASVEHSFDLTAVVRQYETPLLRYVTQLIGADEDEAQDVVQDTFLRLHHQINKRGVDSVQRISNWLYRVAHNLAMDAGRRRKRHKKLLGKVMNDPVINPTEAAAVHDPAGDLGHREACGLAMRELKRLPDEQKNVMLLKLIQGFTLQEISNVTGLKIGTVNYRITQGLRTLSQRLKQAGAI